MSAHTAEPAHTHALLVGVEKYAAGWKELLGPVPDVLEVYKWLRSREVPAGQIKILASPAGQNAALLKEAGLSYSPATSSEVRAAFNEVATKAGDLLFIFWAGHGVIPAQQHEQQRCLFLADATDQDKQNVDFNKLKESLGSTYFKIRRQIIIVDACANYARLPFTTEGQAPNLGDPLSTEQFIFFAARPGETAKEKNEEKRGVFTQELFKQMRLQPDSSWPPDMGSLAARVQAGFKALRVSGQLAQTPIYQLCRDWEGNEKEFKTNIPTSSEQRYALVIGISEHEDGASEGQKPKDHQFTDLNFAARDAKKFATLLEEKHGYTVDCLTDKGAGLRQIMEAIERLRVRCMQVTNPLVLFFFSGHGWKDEAERHFLVPHDGKRNAPFSTLLWDEFFDLMLKRLKTNRLVIFLDTCHAGAIGGEGTKGAAIFDPQTLIGEPGSGRYVIASCQARELSREADGHGIFTSHLLELLGFEETSGFENMEQVDLWDLWEALKKKVQDTVSRRFPGASQTPWANLQSKTNVIVATNEDFKAVRKDKEESFLEALCSVPPLKGLNILDDFRFALDWFIQKGEQVGASDSSFFTIFREKAGVYPPSDTEKVKLTAMRLHKVFAPDAKPAPPIGAGLRTGSASPDQSLAKTDQFTRSVPKQKTDSEQVARSLPSVPTVQGGAPEKRPQPKRKLLSEADRKSVLEIIKSSPKYIGVLLKVDSLLSQVGGVSKDEFTDFVVGLKPVGDPTSWTDVLGDLGREFDEKWDNTIEVVTSENALSVRIGK